MDIKELRIGNFVHAFKTVWQVDNTCFSNIELMETYQPIPLTEEWLVKFGFEKKSIKWENGLGESLSFVKKTNVIEFVVFWYEYIATGEYYVGWRSYYLSSGWHGVEKHEQPKYIDNVHALQNLYFALTGKDLVLKE